MRVRQLDINHDWTWGAGQNNYVQANAAIAQLLNMNINQWLGNCFFDQGAGIDWTNQLGNKNQVLLNLQITSQILNTPGVTGLKELSLNLGPTNRTLSISYQVQTIYSTIIDTFEFNANTLG